MLELIYSHNIIEHLGIKLYQNKPTNVLAELVSNAWDAYATECIIRLNQTEEESYIAVQDNGFGMTHQELMDSYLIIGKHKRSNDKDNLVIDKKYSRYDSLRDRKPMGRKGIGKLAPFGIASFIDVLTISENNDGWHKITWFQMDLMKMLQDDGEENRYSPNIILEDADYSYQTIKDLFSSDSEYVNVAYENVVLDFLNSIESSGTLIVMGGLSIKKRKTVEDVIDAMGRRFTVTLVREDFSVKVHDEKYGRIVNEINAMPEFLLRIPPKGMTDIQIGDKNVKYWVGFVENAEWPQDEAGIGIYAHGKIAQDRPFTFGSKGREIFTRYMYGVVEADWLDELEQDLISTDRTSLNWDADELTELRDWGHNNIKEWVKQYKLKRAELDAMQNKELLDEVVQSYPFHLSQAELDTIVTLLTEITPSLARDNDTKKELIHVVSSAWTHEPMRIIIKKLWDRMDEVDQGQQFVEIIKELSQHLVPESLSLAVTFSQRTYALSLLYDMVHKSKEVDMQKLIEEFPWILEPNAALLTADRSLKRVVEEAEQHGLFSRREPIPERGASDTQRPDFVFLNRGQNEQIVVVELKNPQQELTIENRTQLADYMSFLEGKYPDSDIKGFLIGSGSVIARDNRMTIMSWTEVLSGSRSEHLSLLASMIRNAEASDIRMSNIHLLGGQETWGLLKKMSENDENLSALMNKFEEISQEYQIPQTV